MFAATERSRRARVVGIAVALAILVAVPAGTLLAGPSRSSPSAHATVSPASSAPLSALSLPRSPPVPSGFSTGLTSLPPATGWAGLGGRAALGSVPFGSPPAPAPGLPYSDASAPSVPYAAAAEATLAATERLIGTGALPSRAAYLPSLKLLSSPLVDPAQAISPTYTVSPAPMGIADFGLGPSSTAYAITTPGVRGTFSLQGYNATAGPLYEDTGAYYWSGLSPNATVTPWQSGIQLNTVVTNVSYPGANNGTFWTQNVVDFSGSEIQFIDNIWNFSSPAVSLQAGTLYSYNGTPVYPQFYYDLGPVVPVAFPMTIQLYNNVSNSLNRTTVTFGYHVAEPGHNYSFTYDTVVFNSQPTGAIPLRVPDYRVDGTQLNPGKLLYDAELVVGGPGGGSNAVVNAINGSLNLSYRTSTGWRPAGSAYSYGADTGETSIGLAGWWSGSTEHVDQGPSLLNGLWNTTGGVAAGNITLRFSLSPTYAFAFLGPLTASSSNLSYAPVTAGGLLATTVAPGSYQLAVYADGYTTVTLAPVLTSVSTTLTLVSSPGTLSAPLYMNGEAQAEALAGATAGWTSGPVAFSNLRVNVSQVFNHVNDFGFPEFGLLFAQNVASPTLVVSNVTQGPDAVVLGQNETIYYGDNTSKVLNAPGLGGAILAWGCPNASFSALELRGYTFAGIPVGGAVALWESPQVVADDLTSVNGSYGLWAASSPYADLIDSTANNSSVALTLLASPSSTAFNLSATNSSIGVLAEGSDHGLFSNLTAVNSSYGYAGISSNVEILSNISARADSEGAYVDNSTGIWVNDTLSSSQASDPFPSLGVDLEGSTDCFVSRVSAEHAWGVRVFSGNNVTIRHVAALNASLGVALFSTGTVSVFNVTANGTQSLGVLAVSNVAPLLVRVVAVSESAIGVQSFYANDLVVSDVSVDGPTNFTPPPSVGVYFIASILSRASAVVANGFAVGVDLLGSNDTRVSAVTAGQGATGVEADTVLGLTVRSVDVSNYGDGVFVSNSSGVSIAYTNASQGAFGVVLENSSRVWVDTTRAETGALGVLGNTTAFLSVNGTSAANDSLGVGLESSTDFWVNATVVTDLSIGVVLLGGGNGSVADVSAAGAGATSPWASAYLWGIPTAAVDTELTYRMSVGGLRTSNYPAGLLDWDSSNLVVDGLNASACDLGVMLNGTFAAHLVGLGAYADALGVAMSAGATFNVVTQSAFVNDTSYGVEISSGSSNLVYDNTFIGDNGAGAAYNATHVQAFSSSPSNAFNDSIGVGNYWADWHTYAGGVLAPYYVGSGAWDYHPLGAPEGMYLVTFSATGLSPGAPWSVTLGSSTVSTIQSSISIAELPGNYSFTVSGGADWLASPSSGAVAVTSAPVAVPVNFTRLYTVTFAETGLPSSTSWTVYLNGVGATGSSSSLSLDVPAGTYPFTVVNPAGYVASPSSGSVNVSGNYTVPLTFSPAPPTSTTVTVEETGLAAGTPWRVLFGGVSHSSSATSLTFSVTPGNYSFEFAPVANYTASPASGVATALGSTYLLLVTFAPVTYPVTFSETGLAAGTVWSVTVQDVRYTSSAATLTVDLPNGSFDYQFAEVSGYSVGARSGSGLVAGDPLSVSAAYSPGSAPSFVESSTFVTGLAVALAVAVVGLALALFALLRRPRSPSPPRPASAPPRGTATAAGTSGPPAPPPPWSEE